MHLSFWYGSQFLNLSFIPPDQTKNDKKLAIHLNVNESHNFGWIIFSESFLFSLFVWFYFFGLKLPSKIDDQQWTPNTWDEILTMEGKTTVAKQPFALLINSSTEAFLISCFQNGKWNSKRPCRLFSYGS